MKTSPIVAGIRDAVERHATSISIDGETWVRQPTDGLEAKLAAARMKISELYTERDILHAAMMEAREIIMQIMSGPGRVDLKRAMAVLAKPLGYVVEPDSVEY